MATNRPDTLDPALMRPGRLDRKVEFSLPDLDGRTNIFKIHARSMSVEKDIRYHLTQSFIYFLHEQIFIIHAAHSSIYLTHWVPAQRGWSGPPPPLGIILLKKLFDINELFRFIPERL